MDRRFTVMKKHNTNHVSAKKRRSLRNNAPMAEILLWTELKGKQLDGYKFRRQYSIGPYIADFYCVKAKLAIEVDGESHFMPGADIKDKRRQDYIESFGLRIVRFTNTDVYQNIDGVIQEILDILSPD